MKTVVSNSPNKNIHKQIEANKSTKFGSIRGNKSEDEKVSKGQEGREINQNSWTSNDNTKSGEYVLNWPPKKPGDEEVHDANSAPPMTCASASISENSGKQLPIC